jgi:hypothetical protein
MRAYSAARVCLSDMLGAARKRGLIAALPEIDWIKIPAPV